MHSKTPNPGLGHTRFGSSRTRCVAWFVFASCIQPTGSSHAQTFTVVSQNVWLGGTQTYDRARGTIERCYGESSCSRACTRTNLDRLASHLAAVSGSGGVIVGLQEVDRSTGRACGIDGAAALSRGLNRRLGKSFRHQFGRSIDLQGGSFGNAILTNVPVLFTGTVALPTIEGHEPRNLTVSLVDFGPRRRLWFGVVHLDHRRSDLALAQAEEAALALSAHARNSAWSGPSILVGDFNLSSGQKDECRPHHEDCGRALTTLLESRGRYREITSDIGRTFLRLGRNGIMQWRKLDYIFVDDPEGRLEIVREFSVHQGTFGMPIQIPVKVRTVLPCIGDLCFSDHKTLVARFRWR